MKLKLALKLFFMALKDSKKAKLFLEDKKEENEAVTERGAGLQMLSILQKEGRLIDFLKEDISQFNDSQIGAAVRKIHKDCSNCLEEFVTLRPLFNEAEGDRITVPTGYDSQAIKVVGKVKGNPPYQGVLRHKGWKAHKLSLPKQIGQTGGAVVCPAEIEVDS